jgi:outer membrane protein assembly factor BamB
VEWKTPLPGVGHSSPVVWGDAVLVTTAYEETGEQSLLCIDLTDGHIRWEVPVFRGELPTKHEKNTHASSTPACDGELVFAAFAVDNSVQVAAVSLDGSLAWQTNVGPFLSEYGYGSSLALFGPLVVVNAESRGSKLGRIRAVSFLAALDRKSGNMVWRIRRPEEHGYGSPIVGKIAGREQLIVSGAGEVCSYDPKSGDLIWNCKTAASRCSNSIAFDSQNVYASGNYPQNEIICIAADGEGDVTQTHVNWRIKRGASGVPSPVVFEGRLYVLQDSGVLRCFDTGTGKTVWQKRLEGNFTASPIIAGECLYAANEIGTTYVMALGDKPQIVGTNKLDEPIFATPTPWDSSILIRTTRSLRRITERKHVD